MNTRIAFSIVLGEHNIITDGNLKPKGEGQKRENSFDPRKKNQFSSQTNLNALRLGLLHAIILELRLKHEIITGRP